MGAGVRRVFGGALASARAGGTLSIVELRKLKKYWGLVESRGVLARGCEGNGLSNF